MFDPQGELDRANDRIIASGAMVLVPDAAFGDGHMFDSDVMGDGFASYYHGLKCAVAANGADGIFAQEAPGVLSWVGGDMTVMHER